MKRLLRAGVATIAVSGVLLAAGPGSAVPEKPDDKTILHVLNRTGYGARPGDIERVREKGLAAYIDQQLHPERIADAAMAQRLSTFETLGKSSRQLADEYYIPVQMARQQAKQERATDSSMPDARPRTPEQIELARQQRVVLLELSQQKILRAAYSERQLEEVLADSWFNHFNVFANKGVTQQYLTEYERDVIRPHVFAKFRDLLGATANSPAMLFYLDNWMSADPNRPHSGAGKKGLNENYARELMELHTLGVDGGYTQKDVTEVARAFTGWTIENPRQGGGFTFNRRLHDPGQKVVLGHVIKAGGDESDGGQVLDLLAKQPATARFIAAKLVRHFVSDTPPTTLVDRAAKRFRDSGGDLRDVMRTILASPEFASADAYDAKVKSPFEFVASALRAVATESVDVKPLVRQLQQMGMPLYMCQPPTGYKDTADAWVNTGALVNRINFALQLSRGDQALAQTLGAPEFQRR